MSCNLCGSDAPLQESHITHKFIGRWMKKPSPTPYFRSGRDMDKRLQDLPTMDLLCAACENRFSAWETKFANEIFYPSANGKTQFWYGPWLVKFAASLASRAIQVHKLHRKTDFSSKNSILGGMEFHLSQFLLGQAKNMGLYTQHIYHMSGLAAPVRPGKPMLNRYLERASEIDIPHSDDLSEIMVYVKLPMFIFFSVGASNHRAWLENKPNQEI